MDKGIAIAGNMLVDIVKLIDSYPQQGRLCNIIGHSKGVGGCVPNTAIDIAKIDNSINITAIGKVGNDSNAEYLLGRLSENGIDCSHILRTDEAPTSYSDVMTVNSDGKRTFFHARGANAFFSPDDIDFSSFKCDIFHLGYALLLDKFDLPDVEFGTVMARVLAGAAAYGIKTSIDVVSEQSERFKALVLPCLKHCDYVIINEIEAEMVSGIPLRKRDKLVKDNLRAACLSFKDYGVRDKVIIHFPEGAAAMDIAGGEYVEAGSLQIPAKLIKGTVGAGDAFCAGALYAIYKGMSLADIVYTASCSAASCLFGYDSVSTVGDYDTIMRLGKEYPPLSFNE